MGAAGAERPHAVCIPYPAQGHVTPMLKLAKLLYQRGFCITFVNTEFNHNRLLRSRGPDSLKGLHDFHFESIPDGLPPSDRDATQDIPALCDSTSKNCLAPFKSLIQRLNNTPTLPPVSCIVSDGVMSFTLDAAESLGIMEVILWTTSACGFMAYLHYSHLVKRGLVPLKDASYLTNGYLDTVVDWVPAMDGVRLKDFPSFIRTTDPHDIMLNFLLNEALRVSKATAIILNTFDAFEQEVVDELRHMFPRLYTIGPLCIHTDGITNEKLKSIGSNLWREEGGWLEWLDTKMAASVVYVNFGSITVMSSSQMEEFAWGLANSGREFLWVIRPDLVSGESAIIPPEFIEATKERGLLLSWVPQEQLLSHPSVGVFLTHSGWNSTIESVSNGVPVICWPFFAEQQTNCRYVCTKWGMGMEIDNNVKREEVESMVKEMMGGSRGMEMRRRAQEWKRAARMACEADGSSSINLVKLMTEVLLEPGSR